MEDKFFGEFLVSKGIINEKTLKDILREQEKKNKKIGKLCVEKNYLTKEDVQQILKTQKNIDAPFGEVAKKLRLLTEKEIDNILFLQHIENVHLGELLLDKKIISHKELSSLLEEYNQIQAHRNREFNEILKKIPDSNLKTVIHILKNYFLRQKTSILKPVYINSKLDRSIFPPILQLSFFTPKEVFYIKFFDEKDGPLIFEFKEILMNYLSHKNIEHNIQIFNSSMEELKEKRNIVFYSSNGSIVVLFYR